MSRSHSPATIPIRPQRRRKLARVGIFRGDELSHVSIVLDPRGSFCRSFNSDWSTAGLTARIVGDDVPAPQTFFDDCLTSGFHRIRRSVASELCRAAGSARKGGEAHAK